MTNPDWLKELSNEQLKELIESATHLCIERDKKLVRKYVEEIRKCCIAIEKLSTHFPALNGYSDWLTFALDCEDYLVSL